MGVQAKFKCLECGHEFEADNGGGFEFLMLRCAGCDLTRQVRLEKYESSEQMNEAVEKALKNVAPCGRCGGEMRDDLGPMCRKCKSRDVESTGITAFYD